jgi:hypothetical protein
MLFSFVIALLLRVVFLQQDFIRNAVKAIYPVVHLVYLTRPNSALSFMSVQVTSLPPHKYLILGHDGLFGRLFQFIVTETWGDVQVM